MIKRILTGILLLVFFYVAGAFVLGALFRSGCNDNDEALENAKALSEEQLSRVYSDVEALHSEFINSGYKEPQIPTVIAGVKHKHVDLMHERMILGGCFDNKVYFRFEGFSSSQVTQGEKRIILSWGEHTNAGSEVVWQGARPNQQAKPTPYRRGLP